MEIRLPDIAMIVPSLSDMMESGLKLTVIDLKLSRAKKDLFQEAKSTTEY